MYGENTVQSRFTFDSQAQLIAHFTEVSSVAVSVPETSPKVALPAASCGVWRGTPAFALASYGKARCAEVSAKANEIQTTS
jgi:hypothetical protein